MKKIDDIDDTTALTECELNTVINDPYMLEFLGLDNNVNYLEKELEDALINHFKIFIRTWARFLFCYKTKEKHI